MARYHQKYGDREVAKKKITKEGIKRLYRLFRFIGPQKYVFIAGLAFLILSSLTTLVFPMLIGELLDSATKGTLDKINQLGLILILVFLVNAVFSYFRIYTFAIVAQKTLALLRQTTYNHLIKLPMSFFSSRRVGELNSRISADIAGPVRPAGHHHCRRYCIADLYLSPAHGFHACADPGSRHSCQDFRHFHPETVKGSANNRCRIKHYCGRNSAGNFQREGLRQ
jgi:hypothetical protein